MKDYYYYYYYSLLTGLLLRLSVKRGDNYFYASLVLLVEHMKIRSERDRWEKVKRAMK